MNKIKVDEIQKKLDTIEKQNTEYLNSIAKRADERFSLVEKKLIEFEERLKKKEMVTV